MSIDIVQPHHNTLSAATQLQALPLPEGLTALNLTEIFAFLATHMATNASTYIDYHGDRRL